MILIGELTIYAFQNWMKVKSCLKIWIRITLIKKI
jgi:hypothetical protein